MRTELQYGRGDLTVEIPSSDVTVLRTKHEEGLPNEAAAFREAVRHPIGSAPLKELVGAKDRVAVVIPDITRPLPSDRLLPWLFEELKEITGYFCGEVLAAHERGCEANKASVMVACEREYPIVVTTNGGYPLDQNLYQAVKGISAAYQIVSDGGLIISASRCNDGFPNHGNFRRMLLEHSSPQEMLETIYSPGFSKFDQWQVQLFALILQRARVGLYSEIAADDVRSVHLQPVADIAVTISEELERIGDDVPVAVLPEGPMTVPYLEHAPIRA